MSAPQPPSRGWYQRGYLPHRDEIGLCQSITFRLADSLPQDLLRQLEERLAAIPGNARDTAERTQVEAWLDAGFGGCALRHPRIAEIVQDALLRFDDRRYRLLAWCIMPNHVHALIRPLVPLAGIVQSWKSFTGRWALSHHAELKLDLPTDPKRFWMREYWDRYIRNERHLRTAIEYIHQNPVKAGLCAAPEAWPWSSAASPPPGTPSSSSAPPTPEK